MLVRHIRVLVTVSDNDKGLGISHSEVHNPVAKAINRATGDDGWRIDGDYAVHEIPGVHMVKLKLPDSVIAFLVRFNNKQPASLPQFTLKLPHEYSMKTKLPHEPFFIYDESKGDYIPDFLIAASN